MNKKPPKKALVVALRGSFHPSIVTQAQLEDLVDAQRAEWSASKRAVLLSERVKAAIEHGATVEPGSFYFDHELEMVRSGKRSRKVKEA